MALLDIVIEVLKINCSVVQCTGYASDIEALFYVLFFPTVFIILFVYVISGIVINRVDGRPGALRLLISVTLYAFIVFQGFYSFFAALSKLWWLLLATLFGLFIFIRNFIHGGGGGSGRMPGVGGGGFQSRYVKRKFSRVKVPDLDDIRLANNACAGVEGELRKVHGVIARLRSSPDDGEILKTYDKAEKELVESIKNLDKFLDDHEELKNIPKFHKVVEKYFQQRDELNDMVKNMKKAA
jgi:hypothetical protein